MASYDYTFNSGDGVTPTRLNAARTISNIVNADISASAAIAKSKLALTGEIVDADVSASAAIALSKLATGVLPTAITVSSANLVDGTIVNADISASSAIAGTKIAPDFGSQNVVTSGNVLIGTTTAIDVEAATPPTGVTGYTNKIQINAGNDCPLWLRRNNNASIVRFFRGSTDVGSISVTTTTTAYNTSSDYRLKENPTPLIGGLETIDQLQPCEFNWKADGSTGRGFIAHELQAVVPEAVTGAKDAVDAEGNPEYQGVDASKLVPYLVSAVQELSARVKELEAKLA